MTSLATIPRYPAAPLIGSLPEMRRDTLGMVMNMSRNYGDLVAFKFGPVSQYFVNSPELLQHILVDQADSFEKNRQLLMIKPLLGEGLVTIVNSKHRRERKLVAPAFQHRRVANYADEMARFGESFAASLVDGQAVDLTETMTDLTLQIVGTTLFGTDFGQDAGTVGESITNLQYLFNRLLLAYIPLPLGVPTPLNRAIKAEIAKLDAFVYGLIAKRRADPVDRGDILSMLLAAQDEDDGSFMTDKQVRDEVTTLIIAGHETTAVTLTWAFHLLSQYPEVAERLRQEVDSVLGGRTVSFADVPRLPYALQVFKETLRLYPAAYIFGREASRPIVLDSIPFPKGATFIFSPYALHRRPDAFPDPDRFDPDRFTPEREHALPRHAWLPFGGGPRICIGNQFALMEGQILLATLMQRVRFDPKPGWTVEPQPLITLRPKGGMPMIVRRRSAA